MDALRRLADQLEQAAAMLAAGRPDESDPGAAATGDGGPGALGEVVAALDRQRAGALQARTREMAAAAERIRELADDLRLAAAGYADADESARVGTSRLEQR
jgi:hypothetical protein